MPKSKKICFVIMGFGKKTDLMTGRTLDLDKTYKNIIRPAVEKSGYQCVRADEIQDSGLIDKSMYALLMHADVVIADISTYNPNAIYELGVRHAVRPFTTIILKEQDGKIPFDLDHTRIMQYSHLGEDIGADEANRCKEFLSDLINKTTANNVIDSPLYDFIKDINPPKLSDAEYRRIIGDLADREEHLFGIVEKAQHEMDAGNFLAAIKLWKKACEISPAETYFTQQFALATYKSKAPTELLALHDALNIIEKLNPDENINDPETLGITGAIYKRLWLLANDVEALKRAIKYYEKGFQIRNDYYTGENYALCLNMMAGAEESIDEKTYYMVAAKKIREQIIIILIELVENANNKTSHDLRWVYASLAGCYYGLKNSEEGDKYEKLFMSVVVVDWERETYVAGKKQLLSFLGG